MLGSPVDLLLGGVLLFAAALIVAGVALVLLELGAGQAARRTATGARLWARARWKLLVLGIIFVPIWPTMIGIGAVAAGIYAWLWSWAAWVGIPSDLVAPLAVGLALFVSVLVAAVGWKLIQFVRRRRPVRATIRHLLDWLFQDTARTAPRLLLFGLVLTAGLAATMILGLLNANITLDRTSAPVVLTAFELATNAWVWLGLFVVLSRQFLLFNNKLRARQATNGTPYSYRSIRRWAEEANTPDLAACTRVIAESGDSVDDLHEWLLTALRTGEGHDNPGVVFGDASAAEPGDAPPGEEFDAHDPAPETIDDDSDGHVESAGVREDQAAPEDLPGILRFRLWWNDLGATISFGHILWRFLVPATIIFAIQLTLVQIWVAPWVYPVMLLIAAFAGGIVYGGFRIREKRRLNRFRAESEGDYWDDLSILVKTAETPERTIYYGYVAGKTYASEDADQLAWTLATRADELVNQGYVQPSPALEERYAWLLRRYLPNFEAWREDTEKVRIMDKLVNIVKDAPEGMVPRRLLAEKVIEHDRRYLFRDHVHVGLGHDPRLVAEVYQKLLDTHALVETPVTIENEGEEIELVAVHAGDEPMPPHVAQMRAEFSAWFAPEDEYRYDLPSRDPADESEGYILPDTCLAVRERQDSADGLATTS